MQSFDVFVGRTFEDEVRDGRSRFEYDDLFRTSFSDLVCVLIKLQKQIGTSRKVYGYMETSRPPKPHGVLGSADMDVEQTKHFVEQKVLRKDIWETTSCETKPMYEMHEKCICPVYFSVTIRKQFGLVVLNK